LLKVSAGIRATNIRDEDQLLLYCARTRIDPEMACRIMTLLREEIDWTYLIETAHSHGLLPLLYRSLNRVSPEVVPRALKEYCLSLAGRNLLMANELIKVVDLLGAHDISVIPFKGPTLAALAYGDISLRPFCDIDILVREKDAVKSKNLLLSYGYRWPDNQPADEPSSYLRSYTQYNYGLVSSYGGILIELHWKLTQKYFSVPFNCEDLWERLHRISVCGKMMPCASPEDLMLVLCVHGAKHIWERLEWICDVAELLNSHQEMDWEWIKERAIQLRSERMVFLGLYLANDLLGAHLPSMALQFIKTDRKIESLASQVYRRLFFRAPNRFGFFEKPLTEEGILIKDVCFQAGARDRWQDRLKYLSGIAQLALTPTGKDYKLLSLPVILSCLYYLIRPLRLIWESSLVPLRQLNKTLKLRSNQERELVQERLKK